MFNTSTSDVRKDPYLTQKIMSASPEQLVAYMYDAVILGCKKEDQTPYVREAILEEQFANMLKKLKFDDEILQWIIVALKESHKDQGDDEREALLALPSEVFHSFIVSFGG